MMFLFSKGWSEIYSQAWIQWENHIKRKIKSNKYVIPWVFSLFLKITRLIRLCNCLKLWVLDTQLWSLALLEQEKVRWYKFLKKWKVQQYIVLILNLLQYPNYMDKCIHKLDNGLMVFSQKHLEQQMKKHQEAKKNPGGFFMMVMLMQFGLKIWTQLWTIIDFWLWLMVTE